MEREFSMPSRRESIPSSRSLISLRARKMTSVSMELGSLMPSSRSLSLLKRTASIRLLKYFRYLFFL